MLKNPATVDISNYEAGTFADPDFELPAINFLGDSVQRIGEIFPPAIYERSAPIKLASDNESFRQKITEITESQITQQLVAPSSSVVLIKHAAIWHNHIFVKHNGEYFHVYEFMRPSDRNNRWGPDTVRLEDSVNKRDYIQLDGLYYFIGSAGSKNYGHFLVDDLPRFKGMSLIKRATPLMTSYSDAINSIKVEASEILDIDRVQFISPETPVLIDNLLIVAEK